ncbi:MAG TPA: sigma 54-interacting transcriptional regulator, partial [Gemmataceae bacterium]|nr:sigma 54-interacting transcriptional regulator [Gemmataceae bacterium]
MARILLIDDDDDLTRFLAEELRTRGHDLHCLERAEDAPRLLREARPPFQLVLLDVGLPGMSGIDFLKALRAGGVSVPVVLVTGDDTSETFIQVYKLGVHDYVVKPDDYQSLCARLAPIIDRVLAETVPVEAVSLPTEAARPRAGTALVGHVGGPMGPVYQLIAQFAPADDPVLILGETGTGKELVARALHSHGDRKDRRFIALNCAAVPENLLETELFGHEKG